MLKYVFLIAVHILTALAGCGQKESPGKPVIFVSVLPQAYFAERIGGENIDVVVLIGPGQSPHSFEPTPKQIAKLSRADIYFTAGVSFEKGFIDKIKDSNPKLRVVASDAGIQKRVMKGHGHGVNEGGEHNDDEDRDGVDPHFWLNPVLAKIMARIMCDALIELKPSMKDVFNANLIKTNSDLDALDKKIADLLKPLNGGEFFVFHPSFGYFGDRYGLEQEPVEIEGKEPSAKQLAGIIRNAREKGVKVLFVQPQFAKTSAETIAKEIGGVVVPIDPLAWDYIVNLEEMAEQVLKGLSKE